MAQASGKGPHDDTQVFLEGGASAALTPTQEAPTECGVGEGLCRLGPMHTQACCALLRVLGQLLTCGLEALRISAGNPGLYPVGNG